MTSNRRLPFHDASQIAGVSHKDRLITAGFFVVLLHGVLILGVTFSGGIAKPASGPTFAVTLVQSRTVKAPDHADYIAQANQRGHGNTKDHARPSSPVSNPAPANRSGWRNGRYVRSQEAPVHADGHTGNANPYGQSAAERLLTTRGDIDWARASGAAAALARNTPRLLIARLMTTSAGAADPLLAQARAHDDNPSDRTISVNTRESRFARYLEQWREQVTQIGNLNYPKAIREQHLSGHLTLEVALNADGTLHGLTLVKPSKHAELNAAAETIVRSGAPYAPFPKAIRKDTDVLRFVYEWRFINGRLTGGG
ncbi:MAG TPA: TonB family protein [Gammaproteobacteria bacterium]|nr:TonB family protein [Gammaproteobacteria bacterium]